jgi:signal transduction histidine kinase
MPVTADLGSRTKYNGVYPMERSLLYFLAKITGVFVSVSIFNPEAADITVTVISALSFACIFVLEILLARLKRKNNIIMLTVIITVIACLILGLETYYPLFIISLVHLMDITIDTKMFYYILSIAVLLSMMIFNPSVTSFIFTVTIILFLLFCRIIIEKFDLSREISEKQKETIIELNKKITDIKSLTKTLKYTASIEERNRIAARIHDQLGHGISGSIILLEAAMLVMKNNPDKATASISKAITVIITVSIIILFLLCSLTKRISSTKTQAKLSADITVTVISAASALNMDTDTITTVIFARK